jgi:hypothetical protein
MLVGSWKFDESGSELVDSSGNGLHGDLGNAQRAKGGFGKALYLDGSGGAAVVADNPLLQFGAGDFSIACWIHPVTLSIASEHKRRRLIEKGGYPGTWWNVDLWSDGRVMMEMADRRSTGGTTVSAGGIPEKRWTHLAVTVDRKNFKTRYYLNGKLDSVRDLPKTFTGNLDVSGHPLSTGTWQSFVGMLAELKIYRRLLDDAEIKAACENAKYRYSSASYTLIPDE